MRSNLARGLAVLMLATILAACSGPTQSAGAPSDAAPATADTSATAAAQSTKPAGDKPLFVAIQRGATDQYFIDLQDGFVTKIESLGGVAQRFDAKEDANLAISLVQDAVSAGAKGIATSVAQQSSGPAIAKIAREGNVALVATDNSFVDDAGKPVPFVGFDGKDMGTTVGKEAARLLTEAGWLNDSARKVGVLSVEVSALSVCKDRTDAATEQMTTAGVPQSSVFVVSVGSASTIDAQEAAGPVITAHPDVTNWVIYACNDEGVLGALNAMATQGVDPAKVIGVGLGAYDACKSWTAGVDRGFRSALYISGKDVGEAAAQILWDNVVNGQPLPATTIAKTTMVGPDTWQNFFKCSQ